MDGRVANKHASNANEMRKCLAKKMGEGERERERERERENLNLNLNLNLLIAHKAATRVSPVTL